MFGLAVVRTINLCFHGLAMCVSQVGPVCIAINDVVSWPPSCFSGLSFYCNDQIAILILFCGFWQDHNND